MHLSDEELKTVLWYYSETEQHLKEFQFEDKKLYAPVTNELRYVGRHMLDALTADNPKDTHKEYAEALDHAKRALYDILEIQISAALLRIDAHLDPWKKKRINIQAYIPGFYTEIMPKLKQIRSMVSSRSRNRHIEDGFKVLSEAKGEALKIFGMVDAVGAEIDSAIQRDIRKWLLPIYVAAASLTLAALTFILKILNIF